MQSATSQDADEIEFIVKRQQSAPNLKHARQIFPANGRPLQRSASLCIYRGQNTLRIVYLDFATYDITGNTIVCYSAAQTSDKQLHLNFLGPVMSVWLEQNEFQVLHASAVLVDQKAILFMADSQQGKSTIASSMIKLGYPLLSDDLVAIKYNQIKKCFYAYPSYPVIKLWPDQFETLFKDEHPAEYLDKDLKKCRVRIDTLNSSLFSNQSYSLSVIYHLSRSGESDHLQIESLSNIDAVTNLIRYSFAAPIMIALEWQPKRLREFSKLCTSQNPVRVLKYPSDINRLEELCVQIVNDSSFEKTRVS